MSRSTVYRPVALWLRAPSVRLVATVVRFFFLWEWRDLHRSRSLCRFMRRPPFRGMFLLLYEFESQPYSVESADCRMDPYFFGVGNVSSRTVTVHMWPTYGRCRSPDSVPDSGRVVRRWRLPCCPRGRGGGVEWGGAHTSTGSFCPIWGFEPLAGGGAEYCWRGGIGARPIGWIRF